MTDLFKDGMCCTTGNGRYIGYVDGTQRFSSPSDNSDWETRSHPFSISTGSTSSNGNNSNGSNNSNSNNSNNNLSDLPFDSKITSTTDRDDEWLVAHNTRRKEWHTRYGKSYVPLSWSNALKEQSRDYAEKLLASSCGELIHGECVIVYNTAILAYLSVEHLLCSLTQPAIVIHISVLFRP